MNSVEDIIQMLHDTGFDGSYINYKLQGMLGKVQTKMRRKYGTQCMLCKHGKGTLFRCYFSRENLLGEDFAGLLLICKQCKHDVLFTDEGRMASIHDRLDRITTICYRNKGKIPSELLNPIMANGCDKIPFQF